MPTAQLVLNSLFSSDLSVLPPRDTVPDSAAASTLFSSDAEPPNPRRNQGVVRIGSTLRRQDPAYTLILYGTNDWNSNECRGNPDPPCFTVDSLRRIVRSVKGAQSLPILGTITPVNSGYDGRVPEERNVWVADVDEQRWETAEVGEERRGERSLRIRSAEVRAGHVAHARDLDDRIGLGTARVARSAAGHVGPGRDADSRAGLRKVRFAQGEQRRHREAATRGVARDRDARGRDAATEQPPIGGHGVIDRGGERMLGGQPVVRKQHGRTGCAARARDG